MRITRARMPGDGNTDELAETARVMLLRRVVALRRRTWIASSAVLGVLALFIALIAAARIPFSSETLRHRVETYLGNRLESDVELEGLTLRLAPEVHIVGTGLAVYHKGRRDVKPLIGVRRFTVHTGLLALAHGHIASVTLEGLDLEIPPNPEKTPAQELHDMHEDERRDLERAKAAAAARDAEPSARHFVIDALVADNAQLAVNPRDARDEPKVWAIHQLRMHAVTLGEPMPFHALVTNAVPPGEFDTTGSFGPWDSGEPGDTPVSGHFTLDGADLSVFAGISGMVAVRGAYTGTLGTIRAQGETDTPDFTIAVANHPIPLHTTYRAVIDAMNGDTMLEEVDATFLNTSLVAKGGIYDVKGAKARLVRVHVVMDKGRMEDVMRLVVNTPGAPMVGAIALTAQLEIPPGDQDIVDKLKLDGSFEIHGGRFTDADVQTKINDLSRRASGKINAVPLDAHKVTSTFQGTFSLGRGTLRIPRVTFNIPGALVDISGQYSLRPPQPLSFTGSLIADAKVSQMTTGVKSLLLKVVDPLFRRDGKTFVPLKITGTRSDPSFGLDMKRVLSRGN
ncbi:MAG TPA: hypothetical protein VHZ73_12115 [Vicinamibacterales bacterium]|jgi:hypothetical protein|nr:hypothetical protein [Vicinamibacterales bacterium]